MLTANSFVGMDLRSRKIKSAFDTYLAAQTELFIEFTQDAADDQWQHLQYLMDGANYLEIERAMEQWWNRGIRQFQARLRKQYHQERHRRMKLRLLSERRQRVAAESKLESVQLKLQQAEDTISAQHVALAYIRNEQLCRTCRDPLW